MPDKPFLLKPREVAKAVRKAMAEERLGYQRGHEDCLYDYGDGSGCAIGVALPKWLLDRIENEEELENLHAAGCIRTEGKRELRLLCRLQDAHDRLCEADSDNVTARKRRFMRTLRACERAA